MKRELIEPRIGCSMRMRSISEKVKVSSGAQKSAKFDKIAKTVAA